MGGKSNIQPKIGKRSYYGKDFTIFSWGPTNSRVIIGNYTSISLNCSIMLNGEHNWDYISLFPLSGKKTRGHPKSKGSVIIGNDVWIGYNVIILSGVKIGDGAIVGVGSIVSKDIEPYAIVGGNPTKFIRKRFTDDQIEKLLEIKWWNWPDEEVMKVRKLLNSRNIEEFIKLYGKV